MQQSFAYFYLKGVYCKPRGARTTTWVEEFYIQMEPLRTDKRCGDSFSSIFKWRHFPMSEGDTPSPTYPTQATLVSTVEQGK